MMILLYDIMAVNTCCKDALFASLPGAVPTPESRAPPVPSNGTTEATQAATCYFFAEDGHGGFKV